MKAFSQKTGGSNSHIPKEEFMKVSKINTFFRKIGEGQIKHRKPCIAILLIWTLICLSGMRNFRSDFIYGSAPS